MFHPPQRMCFYDFNYVKVVVTLMNLEVVPWLPLPTLTVFLTVTVFLINNIKYIILTHIFLNYKSVAGPFSFQGFPSFIYEIDNKPHYNSYKIIS